MLIADERPSFRRRSGSIKNLQSAISHGVMPCRTMLDMIAKDLLEILVCPACKQGLEYRQNPESLKCTACHRVYAVKDDIPIMLVDQATVETS
jgi:uncharacterized protein